MKFHPSNATPPPDKQFRHVLTRFDHLGMVPMRVECPQSTEWHRKKWTTMQSVNINKCKLSLNSGLILGECVVVVVSGIQLTIA